MPIPENICGLCYHPKSESGSCNRPDCAEKTMPLVTEGVVGEREFYFIHLGGNKVLQQRKDVGSATEYPLDQHEIAIILLCDRIKELENENQRS